ncbi:MAG: TetR/AcrR family transcriptional regulator [SAR202 cluster bacterium]|jgi:TetR/AcrR family transcriptional repressor of nem operon|nr:TetR/AcrR family transcriptional regulator [SAR202 cluster bacterium]MDP6713887.1 TetR/AcrR family transcriptional regulator [SAR202 cluster bacterium]
MTRHPDTKERLITTGLALMHARGYNAVGVQDICAEAHVHKGSFYYYFPSKRDLAIAVIDRFWETFQSEILTPAFADDISPLERFQRFCDMICQLMQNSFHDQADPLNGCLLGNFSLELSRQDEGIRGKLREIFEQFVGVFERTLAEAVEAEEVPPIDTLMVAQEIVACYEGAAVLAKAYDNTDLAERLLKRTLEIIPQV